MMSVTIILLNILIAQLSLTYELVQEESLNSFIALRMQAVATIEWQSRFKFWVGIITAIKCCKGKNVTKEGKISSISIYSFEFLFKTFFLMKRATGKAQ